MTQQPQIAVQKVAAKNQSVIRAFAILQSFHSQEEWVAACELSRRAGIHEATVNRFMHSLADVGAVMRDGSGRYRCLLSMAPMDRREKAVQELA